MNESKPTNDYQFLESYGLANTSSENQNDASNVGNSRNTGDTNAEATTLTTPLHQRTKPQNNDWFSYTDYPTTTTNNQNKKPLKKILKNKNDFMIPVVRSDINKLNKLKGAGDMKQSVSLSQSQTNLQCQHQQHRIGIVKEGRSSSKTRAYYVLLFVAMYGLFGFMSYIGTGVMEVIRRVQVYRDTDGNVKHGNVKLQVANATQHQHIPVISISRVDTASEEEDEEEYNPLTLTELSNQKEDFNKSPTNTISNDMKDIINTYTDTTLTLSENILFTTFRDISENFETKNQTSAKDFPFFWLIPPYTAGGHRVTRIINECFDLTRADMMGSSKHKITYNSQTRNSKDKEQLLIGSNLFDLNKLFSRHDPIHQKGRMFSFFFHPIQRSAYLFETFKNSHAIFKNMDLTSFAHFIMQEESSKNTFDERNKYKYKVSNWMTRLLSQTPTGALSKYHVDAATLVLTKKCYVGLFHKMEESIKRLLSVFHWDDTSPGGRLGTINCLEEFYGTDFVRDLVVQGSDDWKALEKINEWDIMLYENILNIFEQQHLLLYPN